jgi:hypothetical protein
MSREKANWVKVDPSELSEDQALAFEIFVKARKDFEGAMQSYAPKGSKVIFSYRDGLAIAVVKGARPVMSLSEYLRLNGR